MVNNALVLACAVNIPLLPPQALLPLAIPIVALTIDAVRRVEQTRFPLLIFKNTRLSGLYLFTFSLQRNYERIQNTKSENPIAVRGTRRPRLCDAQTLSSGKVCQKTVEKVTGRKEPRLTTEEIDRFAHAR
ncbi:hypothetical protein Pisl_0396 [Pyrobaculum islandicum DSM 4184]|uniref:Uncharacterized protein n=1 Tax=Pyrobaculum islandicum (strain DSM 4184 / JCM 9189 / GEO3) TaxID=384616 RepID=A1RRJ2_PYRIL|nr:hypothetical protein Pisl_0396 [Pyrobaculum islandicum DSM 4184]